MKQAITALQEPVPPLPVQLAPIATEPSFQLNPSASNANLDISALAVNQRVLNHANRDMRVLEELLPQRLLAFIAKRTILGPMGNVQRVISVLQEPQFQLHVQWANTSPVKDSISVLTVLKVNTVRKSAYGTSVASLIVLTDSTVSRLIK